MTGDRDLLRLLFLAIFFNDLEKVIAIKKRYPRIYAQKEHFLIDKIMDERYRLRAPFYFDLPNLRALNQMAWRSDSWDTDSLAMVKKTDKK